MEARHLFCPVCGVQAFYIPRSNPDGVAITLNCAIEDLERHGVEIEICKYDGIHWEDAFEATGIQSETSETNKV